MDGLESDFGVLAYMNTRANANDIIEKFVLQKCVDKWNVRTSDVSSHAICQLLVISELFLRWLVVTEQGALLLPAAVASGGRSGADDVRATPGHKTGGPDGLILLPVLVVESIV